MKKKMLERLKMKQLTVLTLSLALAALALGCGTTAPASITTRPEVQELIQAGLPRLNYSLAVSPAVLQPVPLQPRENVYAQTVMPNPVQIQNSLVDMLRELQLFKEIRKVKGQAASLNDAINLARSAQSDLLLIPKVKQFNVTYEGRNGAHIPKIIVWSLLEWVSWFMADELYRIDMTCEFEFRDGANGSHLYSKPIPVSTKKPVSDLQRGIKIWGIVRIPGSLKMKNFQKVGAVLGPHAFQDLEVKFLSSVLPAFKRFTQTTAFTSKFSRTAALPEEPVRPKGPETGTRPPVVEEVKRNVAYIIGVDNYDELTVSPLKHAASDARAFREMLSRSVKPEFKADNIHLLDNSSAHLGAMKNAINDAVASSKKKLGTVVFYFAGRGAVVESDTGEPVFYLLPQDTDLTRLGDTAFSLGELASKLRRVNAEQIILILDCGFDPAGEGRSAPTGAKFLARIKYPSALYTRTGYSLLTATGAGKPAYESSKIEGGLLTNTLSRAAASAKTLGDNNALDMREAHRYSKIAVPVEARKLGLTQEPELFGTASSNILFGKE